MVDAQSFRDAMANMGSAVNIITTEGPAGRCGFTASAVCSVTDSPATLLVCMNRFSTQSQAVIDNGVLCVNTLADGHQPLSALFAGASQDMNARYAAARWTRLQTGSPVLDDACASFDCRIDHVTERGTHNVMFCEVLAVRTGGRSGLIYFGRSYHPVGAAAVG